MIPTNVLPRGLLVRTPVMDDLKAVIGLMTAHDLAYSGIQNMTEDDLRLTWQDPQFDLTTALLLVTPEGKTVAYSDSEHKDHIRVFSTVCVHPDYRNLGIESYLLQEMEAKARRHIAQAPIDTRVTFCSHAIAADTESARVFAREGFTHVRSFWLMEREMDAAPQAPTWPADITMRTLVAGQGERAVFDMKEEAFQDHWGHLPDTYENWAHWMVNNDSFDPSLWFLAFAGEHLAGGSLCYYDAELRVGVVQTLGVLRPWRRCGLGMALLLQSFGEFYRRGITKVVLGVDSQSLTGAAHLYTRAGMHVAVQYDTYEKELRPGIELRTMSLTANPVHAG